MGARSRIGVAIATGLLWWTGCDAGGPLEINVLPNKQDAGPPGVDGGTGDAASTEDADAAVEDAGVSPVLVAITPTPSINGDSPTPADALAAELTTFGAGARAAVIVAPWDAVAEAEEDEALAQKTAFYAQHGKSVVLNLAVVDRLVRHRPAMLGSKGWSHPDVVAAMKKTIDTLFASTGPEVRYLTLGRDVDVYLAEHPDERTDLVALTKKTFAYVHAHPDAPEGLALGVAFTEAAPKGEPAFGNLLDLGNVVAFSYFPGIASFTPEKEDGAALVVTQLTDAAGSKPIVLQATGHASDEVAGGSDEEQRAFFATLFGAIASHRKSFAVVNVVELSDAPAAACGAWAVSQGSAEDGPLAAYACSLGFFRADGTAKPAWKAVLTGAAALSSP